MRLHRQLIRLLDQHERVLDIFRGIDLHFNIARVPIPHFSATEKDLQGEVDKIAWE